MKERKVYQCDYCRKIKITAEAMERHEKECLKNPDSVNCYLCELAYKGDYDFGDDFSAKDTPICYYTEDLITERMAHKCEEYRRSDKTYDYRDEEMAKKLWDERRK